MGISNTHLIQVIKFTYSYMTEYHVYYISDSDRTEIWRLYPQLGPLSTEAKETLMLAYLKDPTLRGIVVCHATYQDPLAIQAVNQDQF